MEELSNVTVSQERGFAVIAIRGQIDAVALAGAFDRLLKQPGYDPSKGRLWDFRNATLSPLSFKTIETIAEAYSKERRRTVGTRSAILVARDLDHGIACQIAAVFGDTYQIRYRVCRDFEEACKWLVPPG